jgi:hypothetical protein
MTVEHQYNYRGLIPGRAYAPMKDNVVINRGNMVCLDSSGNALEGTTIAGGAVLCVGRSLAKFDNTGTGHVAGAVTAQLEVGMMEWDNSAVANNVIAATDVGKPCFVQDEHTVSLTSQGNTLIPAGLIVDLPFKVDGSTLTGKVCVLQGAIWSKVAAAMADDPGASFATAITAGTTRTQAGATALSKRINRVDTSTAPSAGTTLGDGVVLPVSVAGDERVVINNTANLVQLYANGSDTINGVTGVTGIILPPGDVAFLVCPVAGAWYFESGLGSSGSLSLEVAADAVTAAGTTQATATQLKAQLNNVTTVAAGTGVNLPASASGLSVIVQNNGVNALLVYPFQGATDTMNGAAATLGVLIHPGTVATFNCTAPGAWTTEPASPVMAALNIVASVDAAMVLTAAQISGGVASVDTQISGGANLTAGRNLQVPTVAALVAALHAPTIGTSFRLRITNFQGGAFAFTVVTNTGWTLTGTTFTVAQNTWREFVVTLTSLTTATLKPVAVGTMS